MYSYLLPLMNSGYYIEIVCLLLYCLQDHLKLLEDMAVLRPTIFCSVPRVYNKLYAG